MPRQSPPTGIAIEDVTVIDAVSGAREHQRVVVDGDLIRSVTGMDGPAPPAAETLDGSGRFLMPGLWDMHVHFLYDDALTDVMPGLFLRYGVTSVRDTGGDLARMTALRERLEASDVPAPRVFLAGPLLDGQFRRLRRGRSRRARHSERACQTPSLRGSRCADSGTRARISSRSTSWSPQKCSTRLPIAAHVPLTMTADVAGPLTNSMEHLRNIELACAADWQELLEERRSRIQGFGDGRGIELRSELHALQRLPAIADFDEGRCDVVLDTLRNTIQVPTLRLNMMRMVGIFARPNWPPALAALPDEVRRNWQERADQMRHEGRPADDTFAKWSQFLTSKLKARGVPIGAGTDTPISLAIPGYALHTELELLVEGGLTPLEAVHAATVQPARLLWARRRDRAGTGRHAS